MTGQTITLALHGGAGAIAPDAVTAAMETAYRADLAAGGRGGAVALDRVDRLAMAFNATGIYRGVIREDGASLAR